MQLFANNEESHQLIQQIQQKAESWAESHLITVVFSSDDFWPYPLMRQWYRVRCKKLRTESIYTGKIANRMRVISVADLKPDQSLAALRHLRQELQGTIDDDEVLKEALSICGGRLSYLNRLAHSQDMLGIAHRMLRREKGWLLSEVGLIPDCDDDVME